MRRRDLRWAAVLALVATAAGLATAACGDEDGTDRTIRVDLTSIELGDYRADTTPTLQEAVDAFGDPDACELDPVTKFASATWRALGLTIVAGRLSPIPGGGNACETPAEVFVSAVEISGSEWETAAGLRVGDTEARVGELYAYARRGPARPERLDGWWLVVSVTPGAMFRPVPMLLAKTRGGKVDRFVVEVGGEGL